jgi:hypothetical protein
MGATKSALLIAGITAVTERRDQREANERPSRPAQ